MEADRAEAKTGPDLPAGAPGPERPGEPSTPPPPANVASPTPVDARPAPPSLPVPPLDPSSAVATARPAAVQASEKAGKPPEFKRKVWRPVCLFLATGLSTFWVGVTEGDVLTALTEPGRVLREQWTQGLLYMSAVMGILLAHEMGHFLQAVRYRVPASLPYFIPMPFSPIGTMGAVILMRGSQANRRELFDIGLSGPWAGLLVVIPLTVLGIVAADAVPVQPGVHWGHPLLLQWMVAWLRPNDPPGTELLMESSPLLLASWVGMLVTGLNMVPVGQMDGGHTAYALLGRKAHWLSGGMVVATLAFSAISGQYGFIVMAALMTMLGLRHPRTADDLAELGWPRKVIGTLSLAIPIFCLTPYPIYFVNG